MNTATAIVTGLLAVLFLSAAAMKLAGAAGALVGLAVRVLGVAATGGLVLLSVGALASHVRAGDPPAAVVPAGLALLLAAAALTLQAATA